MASTIAHTFDRLLRFVDDHGDEQWGNLAEDPGEAILIGKEVEILSGDLQKGFTKTGKQGVVQKLLIPIPPTKVVPCIGLNYHQHAKEAKLTIPSQPVVFVKPPDALAGPDEDIHIQPGLTTQLDYEGELTIIIGADAKNIPATRAADYILGYTVGNDLSARDHQVPASVSGGQYCYAKSFDQFAPIGPCIISSALVPDPQNLQLWTKVNGELRQQTNTNDMVWSVAEIVQHLSRGMTLRKGTAIMTGTPSGVGIFMSPPAFLKGGDVVEIGVEGMGVLRNKIVFD